MLKTYKYRLYPTKKQTQKLEQTILTCLQLYNCSILDRKNSWGQKKAGLSFAGQSSLLPKSKTAYPELTGVHGQVLQDVLKRVDKSYQSFFRRVKRKKGKAGYPRFKTGDRYNSFCYPQSGFGVADNKLQLSKIGSIKIKLHREIKGKIKTCTIKREIDKWYTCFSVEQETKPKVSVKSIAGIDVGIKSFLVTSDNQIVENPKYLVKSEKKLKTKQRQLSKKKLGSNNRKKAKIQVARLYKHVSNQRLDFHHKVSRQLVNRYDLIIVEDLRIQNMVKNYNLSKSIGDAGWGQLLNFVTYKAEEAGKYVIKVDPKNTSQICSQCGQLVKKDLSVRIHDCSCGFTVDRDYNAALNIKRLGINQWGENRYQTVSMNHEASLASS